MVRAPTHWLVQMATNTPVARVALLSHRPQVLLNIFDRFSRLPKRKQQIVFRSRVGRIYEYSRELPVKLEAFPRGFMKRFLLPLTVLGLGAGASTVLRVVVTSRAGFTLTRPEATYLFGWNQVCFWALLILTMALSGYLYLRRGTP
jgi:hypothetical protein